MLWIVLAMIGIVFLIASANVANLLLVRGAGRAVELDVRAALGAGSWRIARSMLAESALLALLGGLVGLVVAYGALQALLALAPQRLPRLDEIALDARSLGFALLVTLAAAALFSIAPILRARARAFDELRGSRGASAGRTQHRAQNALVVGQVALALVLLVSSGLMIRTFEALRAVEPGSRARVAANVSHRRAAAARSRRTSRLADAIGHRGCDRSDSRRRVRGFTNALPMEQVVTNWNGIQVEGGDNTRGSMALRVFNSISPGYLQTMGMSLVAGRDLSFEDVDGLRPVGLVSEGLARELWQTPEAALGHRIRPEGSGGPWREVIGVVADVRMNGLDQGSPATVYWPTLMADFYPVVPFYIDRAVGFAVRTRLPDRRRWRGRSSKPSGP